MMMLMPNDLKPLELEITTKLIKERYVCPIYFGPDEIANTQCGNEDLNLRQ